MDDHSWEQDKLVRTAEAARLLGVRPNTLKIWRFRGTGPVYHRLGTGPTSPVGYKLGDLAAWLEERRFDSTAAESAAREA